MSLPEEYRCWKTTKSLCSVTCIPERIMLDCMSGRSLHGSSWCNSRMISGKHFKNVLMAARACQTWLSRLRIEMLVDELDNSSSSMQKMFRRALVLNSHLTGSFQGKKNRRITGPAVSWSVWQFFYQDLYGRNLPLRVTTTRSPLGSSCLSISMEKSIALMMPSPNFSCISSLMVSP